MILNFKKDFKPLILDRVKKTTIRQGNRWKEGAKIHFYTGSRTKYAEQFAAGTVIQVVPVLIWPNAGLISYWKGDSFRIMTPLMLSGLVKIEGFKSEKDFFKFFSDNYGSKMRGQIIVWSIDANNFNHG
jgi:hypothetical protein